MSLTERIPALSVLSWAAVVALVPAFGCRPLSEEEKLVDARSRYEATLNNFIVKQVPLVEEAPAEPVAEGEEPAAGESPQAVAEAGDPIAETADAETPPDVPVRQDIVVDITLRHESEEPLEGITVDFFMGDGTNDIQNWKVWFDTTDVRADTPGVQFSHTFRDVDYQEGYGFRAEIRNPVPEDERDQYREFADL